MGTATNIDATAVNTISWLAAAETNIVVPVYQRQYRWDIGACEQLLSDIRDVADSDDRHMHFIGSILSSASVSDGESELVLIDGQQRITTLMLLIAALHHTVADSDPLLAAQLHTVLVRSSDPERTKLRPHRAWAEVFEDVVLARRPADAPTGGSRFDDNYAFFRSQVSRDEVARIWGGLQRLEHVAITLGAGADAQQIFESLNSTGEPLRDHELIHNYVLMGLSHREQTLIEDEFWSAIERSTGESIGGFWRHYLVLRTGREVVAAGGRGVYDAFRHEFPRLTLETLRQAASEWRAYAQIYAVLLDPPREPDVDLARRLGHLNTFGRDAYPLVMKACRDHAEGHLDRPALLQLLDDVQSLLLRRTLVGLPVDRLVARLCRAQAQGPEALTQAIARIMPSDERVRAALKFAPLPHAAFVLGRIAGDLDVAEFGVDHIVPLTPPDTWTGDGVRPWSEYTEDEQNSHRALAETIGNLALLEDKAAIAAADRSFPEKRDGAYARSAVPETRALSSIEVWSTAAISSRTAELARRFVEVWRRPLVTGIDDDGLTPILDAQRRRGWPRGWEREFAYVEYRGEHWEVYDVKYLFNRIFRRLWVDSPESVVAFSRRRGGPIYPAPSWNGQWDRLNDDNHLYMGWDAKYMLTALQEALEEVGTASEVFVKYSYLAEHMAT
ncbi:DUF262 domain-containing protein [Microbacterium sp. 1P10UB]|uniref:DUF262 domain-containing protein n=1 Tax=unclassified Microbacterium TaxID=2609290 RepID=UPI0039A0211C